MDTLRDTVPHDDAGARSRLQEAALKLFNRKGYEGTSAREIVAEECTIRGHVIGQILRQVRSGNRKRSSHQKVQGVFILSSQIYSNARDLARFGLLNLRDGVWNGERLLSKEWIDFVRTPAPSTANFDPYDVLSV